MLVLVILALAPWIPAQSTNGTIRGIIRDASKAKIPGVQVTLTNLETKAVLKTRSDVFGEYRFEVPPGEYELTADLPGFSPLKIPNVRLKDSETIQLEFTLTIKPRVLTIPLAPEPDLPPARLE